MWSNTTCDATDDPLGTFRTPAVPGKSPWTSQVTGLHPPSFDPRALTTQHLKPLRQNLEAIEDRYYYRKPCQGTIDWEASLSPPLIKDTPFHVTAKYNPHPLGFGNYLHVPYPYPPVPFSHPSTHHTAYILLLPCRAHSGAKEGACDSVQSSIQVVAHTSPSPTTFSFQDITACLNTSLRRVVLCKADF